MHVQVVAFLQLLVLKDGMQLSDAAAAALTRPAGRSHLPTRLASMLHVPSSYLNSRWAQEQDSVVPSLQSMLYRPVAWWRSRPRDVSDVQWRDFRGGLGPISAAMAGFVALSRIVSGCGCSLCDTCAHKLGWVICNKRPFFFLQARLRGSRTRLLNSAVASIIFRYA